MSVSPLQLKDFFLDELTVSVNRNYPGESGEQHGYVQVTPSEPEAQGDGTYVLGLQVSVGPDEAYEDSLPYKITAVGRGVFALSGEKAADESGQQLLLFNGSALLLGQIRAQVAQVTSFGEHGTMWIPVLNLVDLFTRRDEPNAPETRPAGASSEPKTPRQPRAKKTKTAKSPPPPED